MEFPKCFQSEEQSDPKSRSLNAILMTCWMIFVGSGPYVFPSKCRQMISLTTQVRPGEGPRAERPVLPDMATVAPAATHGNEETAQLRANVSQKSPKSVGITRDKPAMDKQVYFAKSCCFLKFMNVYESRFTMFHHLNSKHKQKHCLQGLGGKNIGVVSHLIRITFHEALGIRSGRFQCQAMAS